MFSETWLSSSEQLNLDIQGYTCDHLYGNKSAGAKRERYSGGISIYYKNYLKNSIHIVEKNQCGVVWVKIQNDVFSFQEDVYICNVYIPPSNSKVLNQIDDIYEVLEQGVLRYKNLGKMYISETTTGARLLKQIYFIMTNTLTMKHFLISLIETVFQRESIKIM